MLASVASVPVFKWELNMTISVRKAALAACITLSIQACDSGIQDLDGLDIAISINPATPEVSEPPSMEPPPSELATSEFPSDLIPFFREWNITMGNGETVNNLIDFEDDAYFYTVNDGVDWVVYKSPNAGDTTPNSSNTRSELRQLQEWTPEQGAEMTGELKVMHVSTSGDARMSPSFAVVVGQIHSSEGHENEPLKIFYKKFPGHTKGSVFWNYEINTEGDNSGRWDFSTAVWGDDWNVVGLSPDSYPPEPEDGIELGEEWSYEVLVEDGIMFLTFESEGHPTRTFEKDLLVSEYDTVVPEQVLANRFAETGQDGFERSEAYAGELQFLKAGAYNQTNGKLPVETGEGATFWNTAGDTYGGDLAAQYANGAFAEVWFRSGTVSSGVDTVGLVNGGFESGLTGWLQVEPAKESDVSFTGVNAAKLEPGGSISQTVAVAPGETYTLTAMQRVEPTGEDESLEGLAGSATVQVGDNILSIPSPIEIDTYELTSLEFNSGDNDEVTITFGSFPGGEIRVDDVVLDGNFPQ